MPVYMVIEVEVLDADTYARYVESFPAMFEKEETDDERT